MTGPFQVVGPFKFDRNKVHEREYRNCWWDERDNSDTGISHAKGVYLISIRNKKNYVPQYVGITKKQSFRKEVFRDGNLRMISHDFRNLRGSCQLHLIVKPKSLHEGFSVNISSKALQWLEQSILFSCLTKNPDMQNKSHRVFLRSVDIGGVTGESVRGKKPTEVVTFMNALGH